MNVRLSRLSQLSHHRLTRRIDALCARYELPTPRYLTGQESNPLACSGPYSGVVPVLPFILSTMPDVARTAYFSQCLCAPCLILADYRLPERNLDFPAYWLTRLSLQLHPSAQKNAFLSFIQRGGIEGLVHAQPLAVRIREILLCGAASLLLCFSSKSSLIAP